MLKKSIILNLIILIVLTSVGSVYAQDLSINIAVLPFDNELNDPNYNYIQNSLQESISTSIKTIKDVTVIDNQKVNKTNEKLKLNYDNIEQMSKSLRFAVEAGCNVIIVGKYKVVDYDYIFKTSVYSIAQKKIIDKSEITGKDEFDLIDTFSKNIVDKLLENKDSIEVALEDIAKDIQPPVFTSQPSIKEVTVDGVIIDWETNKETVSNLYLSEKKDFTIDKNTLSFEDLSKNALYHWVMIDYKSIDPKKEYYFKTSEEDLFDNKVHSQTQHIEEKHIYNKLKESYDKEVINKYKKLDSLMNEKAFNTALKEYKTIIGLNSKYRNLIEVIQTEEEEQKTLRKMEKGAECMNLVEKANQLLSERKPKKAKALYIKAIKLVKDNSLEKYISPDFLQVMVDIIDYSLNQADDDQEQATDDKNTTDTTNSDTNTNHSENATNSTNDDNDIETLEDEDNDDNDIETLEDEDNDDNDTESIIPDIGDISKDDYSYLGKLYQQAEQACEERDYYYALRKYEEIAEVIGETEALQERMTYLEKVLEAERLIEEGDLFYGEKMYKQAKLRYEKAMIIIEEEGLEKLFPMDFIKERYEQAKQIVLEENRKPTFINVDFGYSFRVDDLINELVHIDDSIYMSVQIQLHRYFSLGFGLGIANNNISHDGSFTEEEKPYKVMHFDATMGLYAHKGFFQNFIINIGLVGENYLYFYPDYSFEEQFMIGPSLSLKYMFKLWVFDFFVDGGLNILIHLSEPKGVSLLPLLRLGFGISI
jgi:hypothetical protein